MNARRTLLPLASALVLLLAPAAGEAQQRPQQAATGTPALPRLPKPDTSVEQVPLAPPPGMKAAPVSPGAKQASTDFRATLRQQVEDELAQLRPRLKMVEQEAQDAAEKYKEMAASKAEVGKKAAEKTETAKARADAAAARQGYKPKMPGKGAGAKAGAGGDKGKAADAKGGEGGGAAAGGAAPKKVDPVLTQQYVVMSLRDQIRQLRERITYLEELRTRLGGKS